MGLLSQINEFSGLLTFVSFVGVILWFVFGLRSLILGIKDDYTDYKIVHQSDTNKLKTVAYEIKEEIKVQAIHQEYMRRISEDSTAAITKMNTLLSQLSITLTEIKDKFR